MTSYEIIELPNGNKFVKKTDEDGKEWGIPMDDTNSDYQTYLKRDEPQVEHLTGSTEL